MCNKAIGFTDWLICEAGWTPCPSRVEKGLTHNTNTCAFIVYILTWPQNTKKKAIYPFSSCYGTYKILSNKILSVTFTKVSIHHPILNKGISVETDNIEDLKNPFKFDGDKLVLGKMAFKKIEKKKQ